MTSYQVWLTVRDWLLSKGWTRTPDDPGGWIPPNSEPAGAVTITDAFASQVQWDGWGWDGPVD